MAKISAHGETVGTVYFTTSAKRYMSDGRILINRGAGWKLGPKLKAGLTPVAAFERQAAAQTQYLIDNPAIAEYRKALHDLAGMNLRARLNMVVSMMPDDVDGVWSDCCDGYGDNVSASVEEIAALCMAYRVAARAVKCEVQL